MVSESIGGSAASKLRNDPRLAQLIGVRLVQRHRIDAALLEIVDRAGDVTTAVERVEMQRRHDDELDDDVCILPGAGARGADIADQLVDDRCCRIGTGDRRPVDADGAELLRSTDRPHDRTDGRSNALLAVVGDRGDDMAVSSWPRIGSARAARPRIAGGEPREGCYLCCN
jgi:hypothetical protein